MPINKKFAKLLVIIMLVLLPLPALAQGQAVDSAFNPEKLIDDKVFGDMETFGGPQGIQKFLEIKGSVLANTSPDFLVKLKEPTVTMLKQGLDDPQPNLGRLRTAAELIWDASRASGLNPQVILVTLNKEQGLITAFSDPNQQGLQRALDFALGFGCPDSTGCSQSMYPGFYYQLFGNFDSSGNRYLGAAKSLMKSFSTPNGRGPEFNGSVSHVGDVITLENTMGGYDGIMPQQTLQLSNRATAALYRFTPHVYNGNYNFWKYFQAWFKYPNGTLLKLANGLDTYIIQNGVKQLVPLFVAQARNLNLNTTVVVSPNEFDSYQTDKVLGPVDDTIVTVAGENKKYLFQNNIKHLASDLVLKQRGLNPEKVITVSAQDAMLFDNGTVLPPKDGTVIRGVTNKAVYLVQDGKIKLFSAFTFGQRKVTAKSIYSVPDDEISTYTQNGFVPPLDGTLVKASNSGTVYQIQNGLKQPVLGEIFKNRGFSYKQIASLAPEEVDALPAGGFAAPKDYTFFAIGSKTGQQYEYKEGSMHPISDYVIKQRKITPDYVFSQDVASTWQLGMPVPPKDGTIIKGDKDGTVYLVQKGQLRPLTLKAFNNRRIKPKQITTLPQSEVDGYGKGDTIEK